MGICIVGHFGGNKAFNDGQTVKTITTYNALRDVGITDIDKIDTYYIKRNPFRFLFLLTRGLLRDQKFILLLSINGRRVLFPVFYYASKLLGKEIYHYAIGGRLADEASQNAKIKKYISSFSGNWVESHYIVQKLNNINVMNAVYVPNFKRLKIMSADELPTTFTRPYKLCTFSRVMPEKGIEDAIQAIQTVNQNLGRKIVTLDIYGPIAVGYENDFKRCIEESQGTCRYCGVVSANRSVETLKDYFLLLFPTRWFGEGMPGTIIDAFSAGVPVIARDWKYCREMIIDQKTGFIYPFEKPERLSDLIFYAIQHVDLIKQMRVNCLHEANKYSEHTVIKKIKQLMNLEEC